MKFKMRLKHHAKLVDMTPLVDVVFLMLIFFMLTSDILPLKSLNIETPTLDTNSSPLTTQLIVVMDGQQVIYMGREKEIVDILSYKSRLLKEIQRVKRQHPKGQLSVALSVDQEVDYGTFMKIFALTQECGQKIRLVYHEPEDKVSEDV